MQSPLLSFGWFYSAISELHKNDELAIVIFERGSELEAIAPLIINTQESSRQLEIVGARFLREPTDWLYKSKQALIATFKEVLKLGLPLELLRIAESSLLIGVFSEFNKKSGVFIYRRSVSAYYLDLKPDGEQIDADQIWSWLSSKRRYDFKRKRKCLEKLGDVDVEIVNPDKKTLTQQLNEVMRVEHASWKGEQNSSLLTNEAMKSFFEKMTRSLMEEDKIRVFFLKVNQQNMAMHLVVQSNSALWVLKLGHDATYNKCSPGMQMAMETILYSVENNLARYEFLGSAERWQEAWPVKEHTLSTCLFVPFSIRGVRYLIKLVVHLIKTRNLL
jgi:CelD/BcsL family acetyltransferase involved in cellulose biosynthesis